MKVMITGSADPLEPNMWYAKLIGEIFEVEPDPQFDNYYKTILPISDNRLGHIKKIDCKVVTV